MSRLESRLFPKSEFSRIEAAVKEAESKTSGEIVPYVVEESDPYEEAEWRAGLLFAALVLVATAAFVTFTSGWLTLRLDEISLLTIAAAGAGVLLARFVGPVKRLFAGRLMERRVHQRAVEAFVTEEVFNTHNRTGILIFVSLLEHRVLVLGDSGINAKVNPTAWDGVVNTIVSGVRNGKGTDALIEAIRQCGSLLQQAGVKITPDDQDELPDNLRLGDRPRP